MSVPGRPLRVLVAQTAQDSRLSDALASDPTTEVAGIAHDGIAAVTLTERLRPDAVVMVAHLPGIDGLEATRRIMSETPTPIVLAIEGRDAAAADREAAQAGALGTVPMPPAVGSLRFERSRADLSAAVHAMARVKLVRRTPERNRGLDHETAREGGGAYRVVAIGASTGGPAAVRRILAMLPNDFPCPVLLTQHISPGFTIGMVRWLDGTGSMRVKIAEPGDVLRPGVVYVAPDDCHLTLSPERTIALDEGPPVDGHRPSVSAMFRSVSERFGPRALAVVLTGMGRDGSSGVAVLHEAGATVWAQDEASCSVFGMPKIVIDAGMANLVLPLDAIADHLIAATAM